MKQKLFRSLLLLTVTSVALVVGMFAWLAYHYITTDSYNSLQREANLLLESDEDGRVTVKQLRRVQLTDRVTMLDPTGKVLFDNYMNAKEMENHMERPEIKQAMEHGEGYASRPSQTLGKNIIYYALELPDGNILRLARTNEVVFQQANLLLGYFFFILVLILGGAFIAARSITRRVLEPLEKLDLENPVPQKSVYPELEPIVERFATQQDKLNKEMRRYKNKKQELKAVTNNMNEGMLFLDTAWNVQSINKSAIKFYGKDKQELLGKNILDLEAGEDLRPLLQDMEVLDKGYLVINKGSTYFQFNASRIADKGFVLLIMDVTERTASEKLRREFSANVSHELKTPLQSVLGYSEIMLSGLVRPEDTKRFLQKIYDEAQNLLRLIDDVIKLSKLDELNHDMMEEFSLTKVAESAMRRLQDKAGKAKVLLQLEDTLQPESHVLGIASLMEEVFFNLLDNGIKYNHAGGSVTLRLSETESKLCVNVVDTGMGIPTEELPHIFERFYRVDRSRHKAIDGTGLGLSIVKHGVLFHHGSIRVVSTMGKGTEFIIKFPKNAVCIQDRK
ncbi:ATP-binding protein [Phascolarctobacterium sp.]|uniref:sensor histidine kinase n=1 Tax=Phascolarctobacterium sp. TaxID=2049039 RepID=UPI003870C0D8